MEYRKLLPLVLGVSLVAAEPVYTGLTGTESGVAYAASKKKQKRRAPGPLRGSPGALLEQNRVANSDDLSRIEDENMLNRYIRSGYLVELEGNRNYRVDHRLDDDLAYVRPWTKTFVERLSRQYRAKFGEPLVINSAVRTKQYQRKLDRLNGNAAPAEGPKASSHMTGATVDIGKKTLSPGGIRWLRQVLSDLDRKGIIEATEEHRQAVFHVMVYRDEYRAYLRQRKVTN